MSKTKKRNKKMPAKKVKESRLLNVKNLLIVLFVACFAGAGYFILFSKAAGPVTNTYPSPSIYLSPTTQPLQAGQTFQVQVRADSGTTNVNAVEADFTYPTNLVDFVSIDTANSAYQTQAIGTGGNGSVSIARGQIGGLTGNQLVATVTFTAKTTGGTANFQFVNGTSLLSSSTNMSILPSLSSAHGATYKIDTQPPSVSVSAPANAANVEYGATQSVSVTASDADSDVQKVEIYVDGALRTTLTTSPYNYSWATAGLAEGSHSIYARAYDQFNQMAQSATVVVNVADRTAPTVSVSSPAAGATLSGTATISASAGDNNGGRGVAKVDFYRGTTLIGTDTTSPYSVSWDTKTVADGSYAITAKATDSAIAANNRTSSVVNVTVDNADRVAPTQPGSFKTTSITLNSIAFSWTASTDNVGVTAYKLSRNGQVVYQGTALSYTDTGLSNGTTYNYSLVAVDAANNSSSAASLSPTTLSPKKGDVNFDNLINIQDISIVIARWGTADGQADLNKNGVVDIADISIVISNWGL